MRTVESRPLEQQKPALETPLRLYYCWRKGGWAYIETSLEVIFGRSTLARRPPAANGHDSSSHYLSVRGSPYSYHFCQEKTGYDTETKSAMIIFML